MRLTIVNWKGSINYPIVTSDYEHVVGSVAGEGEFDDVNENEFIDDLGGVNEETPMIRNKITVEEVPLESKIYQIRVRNMEQALVEDTFNIHYKDDF